MFISEVDLTAFPAESATVKVITPAVDPELATEVDSSVAVMVFGLPTKVIVFAACVRFTPPIDPVSVAVPAVPSL